MYLYEHGSLRLHHHLQQRLDQRLRGGWDQVEEVDDGRTDLHLLEGGRRWRRVSQAAEEYTVVWSALTAHRTKVSSGIKDGKC